LSIGPVASAASAASSSLSPETDLQRHGQPDADHVADQIERMEALAEDQPARHRRAHRIDPRRLVELQEFDREAERGRGERDPRRRRTLDLWPRPLDLNAPAA